MNNVYIVISVKGGAELEVCEVYSDLQVALGRASAIAHFAGVHHPEWLQAPKDKGLDVDYTRRWVFLDNYSNYIAVHSKKVIEAVAKFNNQISNVKTSAEILTAAYSESSGSISYNNLVTQLKPRDPEDFLVEVLESSDLINWQRLAAMALLEHWAISNKITNRSLKALWKYTVGKLSLDPDEFSRLIVLVCQIGDDEALEFASKEAEYLYQTGGANERHWAERAKYSLPMKLPVPKQLTPKDDPMDPSLPAGWSYSGKPVTMADLLSDPYNVSSPFALSDVQRWALVTSRVAKRPNFSVLIPSVGTLIQAPALHELKNKTTIGNDIVLLECTWLDKLLNDAKGEDEESSSESSEDY